MRVITFGLVLALLPATSPAAESTPQTHCVLSGSSSHVVGSCGRFDDETPKMQMSPSKTGAHGVWRTDVRPTAIWAGDMTLEGSPNAFIQLEVYAGDKGILRTVFGWFPVSNFISSPSGLSFDLDAAHEVSPNALDRTIIVQAAAILSNASVWNRADNRKCPAAATTWSIYCAMEKATDAVTGGVDHRRPAMEVVREIVDDRSAGRNYDHRLMELNNDRRTTLADVASLFAEALKRMDDRSWLLSHGFGG
jgi:hypothetical protein